MTASPTTPGLYFTLGPKPQEPSPVRTDIACFAGSTARGPLGVIRRIEGWKSYLAQYGGVWPGYFTPYAVQAYFTNGGEVAWICRIGGRSDTAAPVQTASTSLVVRELVGLNWRPDSLFVFPSAVYTIAASSEGAWANGTEVDVRYTRDGLRFPKVDVVISCPHEPLEYLAQISLGPRDDGQDPFAAGVNERSALIRISAADDGPPVVNPPAGPRFRNWSDHKLVLQGGSSPVSGRADYLDAVTTVTAEPEPALMAFPDLYQDVTDTEEYLQVLASAVSEADALHDRQVIIDVAPCPQSGGPRGAAGTIDWVNHVRDRMPGMERTAVVYHPTLKVRDSEGSALHPLREIPASGAVAGLIARLDRQRGPFHTPANATLYEVADVSTAYTGEEQTVLFRGGVNLLRCAPNSGIVVWGGRTLSQLPETVFLAHRRLVHRLVRAFERVAEPLVFDVNTPALWQTFSRSITGVLLRAWRSGALKGAKPEEAFTVKCDAGTNPPESIDLGRVVCVVQVAPAAPMEFITLRIAAAAEGTVEVFES